MKKIMRILPVVFVMLIMCVSIFTSVFANNAGIKGVNTDFPTTTNNINTINTGASRLWGSILTILQFVAFGAIVFAGIKYMFASADQKAEVKKSLGILAIGALLVFAASTIVGFIVSAAEEVIQ